MAFLFSAENDRFSSRVEFVQVGREHLDLVEAPGPDDLRACLRHLAEGWASLDIFFKWAGQEIAITAMGNCTRRPESRWGTPIRRTSASGQTFGAGPPTRVARRARPQTRSWPRVRYRVEIPAAERG